MSKESAIFYFCTDRTLGHGCLIRIEHRTEDILEHMSFISKFIRGPRLCCGRLMVFFLNNGELLFLVPDIVLISDINLDSSDG
jgi:hypothetical protein